MATRAVLQVQRLSAVATGVGRQPASPREIVGVDVVETGLRIERLSAILGTAVKTWKHDGLFVNDKWQELPARCGSP